MRPAAASVPCSSSKLYWCHFLFLKFILLNTHFTSNCCQQFTFLMSVFYVIVYILIWKTQIYLYFEITCFTTKCKLRILRLFCLFTIVMVCLLASAFLGHVDAFRSKALRMVVLKASTSFGSCTWNWKIIISIWRKQFVSTVAHKYLLLGPLWRMFTPAFITTVFLCAVR